MCTDRQHEAAIVGGGGFRISTSRDMVSIHIVGIWMVQNKKS